MSFRTLLPMCTLLLMCSMSLQAQIYVNEEWVYESGVADNLDWASSSFDADGNLIVVGNVSVTPGNSDVLVTKYDQEGNMLWQQTYDGPASGFDYGVKAVCDAGNNTYVAAAVMGSGTEHDITVLKYDVNGDLQWTGTWSGTANLIDAPVSMLLDPNGHLYVGGISHATLTNIDYALVKFGTSGQVLWSSTYDHAGLTEIPTGIELDISMNPVITGGSASSVSNWDFATVVYEQMTGNQLQVSRVNTPGVGLDRAHGIAKDVNANLYVTGYTENAANWDIQTVKLDAAFNLDWTATWDGSGNEDAAKAIGTDGDGNVLITGYTTNDEGGSEFITIKYDDTGNQLWEQRFKPEEPTWQAKANKLVIDGENNCLVTGTMYNGDDMNFWTVAYNPDGELMWAEPHDGGNGDDEGMDIITDGENIFITGLSNTGSGTVYTTVKYATLVKEENILYDGNGDPVCVADELIIKFAPDVVDPALVDDRGWRFGELEEVVGSSVANDMYQKIGKVGGGMTVTKIFTKLTTDDQYSTSRTGRTVKTPPFWSTFLLHLEPGMDIDQVKDSLNTMAPSIHYAELNGVGVHLSAPNDPLYSNDQLGLYPNATYPDADINVEDAWDTQTGQPHVKVGIYDEPIYWAHEDFGDGTFAGSKVQGGYDYYANLPIQNVATPPNSHGTAVAGIVGALRNNGTGVAGVAGGDVDNDANSGASLYSMAIFNNNNLAPTATVANAIVDGALSTGQALDIQNHSWATNVFSDLLYEAVNVAYANECLVVAGRGNNNVTTCLFPAGIGWDEWVLSVGANGTNGKRKVQSSGDNWFGSSYDCDMDLLAPGVTQLVSAPQYSGAQFPWNNCTLSGDYSCFNGTSASAPHAAGVAALMFSEHNQLNGAQNNLAPDDVEFLMQRYATDITGIGYSVGPDAQSGHGRINAAEAVEKVALPYYRVFHSWIPTTSTQNSLGTTTVNIGYPMHGLSPGSYTANRVEITHTYNYSFWPSTQILDYWPRLSATQGYGNSTFINARQYGNYTFNFSGNDVTVIATTVVLQINGQWYPADPNVATTGFSLHLYNPNGVGVDEFTASDAPLRLFPNPATQQLSLLMNMQDYGSVQIEIYDVAGRLVQVHDLGRVTMLNETLDIRALAKGSYNVVVRIGSQIVTERFTKT